LLLRCKTDCQAQATGQKSNQVNREMQQQPNWKKPMHEVHQRQANAGQNGGNQLSRSSGSGFRQGKHKNSPSKQMKSTHKDILVAPATIVYRVTYPVALDDNAGVACHEVDDRCHQLRRLNYAMITVGHV
jgi:hypothetical protein